MWNRRLALLCGLVLLLGQAAGVFAQDEAATRFYFQGGPYLHFNDRDDFEGVPVVAAMELDRPDRWFYGLSLFNNSFGEAAGYAYAGRTFPVSGGPWRLKISTGIVCGYDDEHEEDLPVRFGGGCGLGLMPAVGYKKKRVGFDVAFFGKSGVVFLIGTDL